MVYKGMFVAPQFLSFYSDLKDKDLVSAMAMVHQRLQHQHPAILAIGSSFPPTLPTTEKFNTLRRNLKHYACPGRPHCNRNFFGDELNKLHPIAVSNGSDSAVFDNVF